MYGRANHGHETNMLEHTCAGFWMLDDELRWYSKRWRWRRYWMVPLTCRKMAVGNNFGFVCNMAELEMRSEWRLDGNFRFFTRELGMTLGHNSPGDSPLKQGQGQRTFARLQGLSLWPHVMEWNLTLPLKESGKWSDLATLTHNPSSRPRRVIGDRRNLLTTCDSLNSV
jgi:hypothetical protein